jgi:hypothetical protein
MKCKFCGCTEKRACQIPMRVEDGQPMIALAGQVSTFTQPCEWIAESICSNPACVEQAYQEAALLADQIDFFLERSA